MNTLQNFIIYGEKFAPSAYGEEVNIITDPQRGTADKHQVDLKDNEKLLEFEFHDNTTWMCDATTLHEVFPEADVAIIQQGKRRADDTSFEIPPSLEVAGSYRSLGTTVALKLLKVVAKDSIEGAVKKLAKKPEDKNLINGLNPISLILANGAMKKYIDACAGLFQIDTSFDFQKLKAYKPINLIFFLSMVAIQIH